jgi:folate-dependent phosphoribosylglycinamide formyltransferase PurN
MLKDDSAENIAAKLLALEHRYFAGVIESLL